MIKSKIINIKGEINEKGNRTAIQITNQTKTSFSEKMSNINKPLARPAKKRVREKGCKLPISITITIQLLL